MKDNPYRYAGYQYDGETGMYYLIARYYNPRHGVYLSLDPHPGDEDDILTQNGYSYANNNPVMFVDPDGEFAWFIPVVMAGYRGYKIYKTYKKVKKVNKAAKNAARYQKLKTHYRLSEKYGTDKVRQLKDGRNRYYGKVKPAKTKGEMAGRRLVREWNPKTGKQRTWHETLDHKGRVWQVRPQINGQSKKHYVFDKKGKLNKKW